MLVRHMEVLTAAHCVSDDNNNPIPVDGISVCRYDSNELCNWVDDIDFMDSYRGGSTDGGGTDFDDDWAILELRDTWVSLNMSVPETMNLSAQSDTELSNIGKVYNLANPGDVMSPGCNNANGRILYSLIEDEPIAGIANDHVRLKIDAGAGASGSPFYSCPAGASWFCGEGQPGVVFAVQAGYNPVNDRIVGPKVPHDREIMLGFVND